MTSKNWAILLGLGSAMLGLAFFLGVSLHRPLWMRVITGTLAVAYLACFLIEVIWGEKLRRK